MGHETSPETHRVQEDELSGNAQGLSSAFVLHEIDKILKANCSKIKHVAYLAAGLTAIRLKTSHAAVEMIHHEWGEGV